MTSFQNLFITKLPRSITDNDLLALFAPHGARSAKVMLNPQSGKSKGFGFILFASAADGLQAHRTLNGMRGHCRNHNFTFILLPSTHNGEIAAKESSALFIRNIPMAATQDHIVKHLGQFGPLVECAMRPDHSGSPVWVVYAEYEDVATAMVALSRVHGRLFPCDCDEAAMLPMMAKFAESEAMKMERRRRQAGVTPTTATPAMTNETVSYFRWNPYSVTASIIACA